MGSQCSFFRRGVEWMWWGEDSEMRQIHSFLPRKTLAPTVLFTLNFSQQQHGLCPFSVPLTRKTMCYNHALWPKWVIHIVLSSFTTARLCILHCWCWSSCTWKLHFNSVFLCCFEFKKRVYFYFLKETDQFQNMRKHNCILLINMWSNWLASKAK